MSRITVEMFDGRIESRGWAGPDTPTLSKSVPGAKWSPDNPRGKCWTYPLDMGVCRALRAAFGDRLAIGPELNRWAKGQRHEEAKLAEIRNAGEAKLLNVPRYAPRIAEAMANRTYQSVGAAFGARLGSFGLTDQPGLGKTIQALGAIVEAEGAAVGAHLVFCPKVAVESVWAAEIAQWLGDRAAVYALTGTRAQREATLEAALDDACLEDRDYDVFVIGNIEMVRIKPEKVDPVTGERYPRPRFRTENAEYPALFDIAWDTVIVDESHRALIRKTGTPTQQRAGFTALTSGRRIALSGTPMRGKPEKLWGTLNWLRPDVYTSYWNWIGRYFKTTSNGYSNYVLDGFKRDGEERLAADLQSIMLRRTKKEVLSELPDKQYTGTYLIPGDDQSPHAIWLTLEGAQEKAYRSFSFDGALEVEGGEIIANGHLAEATRQKQLAGATLKLQGGKVTPILPSVKFDWLVEKLDELGILEGEGDGKIVVASQFTSLLNLFASQLRSMGVALHLLTGETPDKARQAMVRDFQTTDDVRVFLLNTHAGGVAVTLDRADDLVLLDETYIPDDQEQVEDRVHRTSRMHQVTIHRLKVLDTIEEEIAWVTAAREDVTRYLLDGARGVEAARKLYEAKAAA
jgi:SNF2 family DNA or RNA helicase